MGLEFFRQNTFMLEGNPYAGHGVGYYSSLGDAGLPSSKNLMLPPKIRVSLSDEIFESFGSLPDSKKNPAIDKIVEFLKPIYNPEEALPIVMVEDFSILTLRQKYMTAKILNDLVDFGILAFSTDKDVSEKSYKDSLTAAKEELKKFMVGPQVVNQIVHGYIGTNMKILYAFSGVVGISALVYLMSRGV